MLSTGIYRPQFAERNNRRKRMVELSFTPEEIKNDTGEKLSEHWEYQWSKMMFMGPAARIGVQPANGFADSNLDPQLIDNAREVYDELSPLQRYTIPVILSETADLLVQAQTGSGKTASFLLPAIQMVINAHKEEKLNNSPLVVILANTGNLALQTYTHCCQFAGIQKNSLISNVKCTVSVLTRGAMATRITGQRTINSDIVIATMGSLLREIQRKNLHLNRLKLLILDEADKMMEHSAFATDVLEMYEYIPEQVQQKLRVAMFSATYEEEDGELIYNKVMERLFRNNKDINVLLVPIVKGFVTQRVVLVEPVKNLGQSSDPFERFWNNPLQLKLTWLMRLLEEDLNDQKTSKSGPFQKLTFIFVETKRMCNFLSSYLTYKGYSFLPYNSDFDLTYTKNVERQIREKKIHGIVATNKIARGADLPHIEHVIIFDMSKDFVTYEHRIGRTGRAGHGGKATILYLDGEDDRIARKLFEFLKKHDQMIPLWLSEKATCLKYQEIYLKQMESNQLNDDDDDSCGGVVCKDMVLEDEPESGVDDYGWPVQETWK